MSEICIFEGFWVDCWLVLRFEAKVCWLRGNGLDVFLKWMSIVLQLYFHSPIKSATFKNERPKVFSDNSSR